MPLISFNPTMTIKKAIIIGTLCAIGASLTAFAVKNGINIKPKTMTAVNGESLNIQKNKIETEALTNGWQYKVNPTETSSGQQTFWTNPETFTYTETTQPTNYENTSWKFKAIINADAYIDSEIYFTSAGTNFWWITCDGDSMVWFEETDTDLNNPILVYHLQSWTDSSYMYITITQNPPTYEKNWIWNNTERTTETYLGNKRNESNTTSYLGIEYIMLSQKTFDYDKIKNETLFFIKIQSTGITRQLFLEDATFYTAIPNMSFNGTYATYNAQFKMAKMTSMHITTSTTLYQQKTSFLNYYNSIQDKTNIYSVDAYVSGNTMNQQQNITYTNETGTTRLATFGHAVDTETNTSKWTINNQETDIYSQSRANYVVIYYNCEVSNFGGTISQQQHPYWHQYAYQYVGATTEFNGYGISSNPITPPDIEDGNFVSLTGMILNILTLPFTFLSQAFDLTLWANTPWAFNIKNAIFVMIGIMTFIFIIKLFTRGFDSLGNFSDGWQKHKLTKEQRKIAKANRQKAEKKVNKDKK